MKGAEQLVAEGTGHLEPEGTERRRARVRRLALAAGILLVLAGSGQLYLYAQSGAWQLTVGASLGFGCAAAFLAARRLTRAGSVEMAAYVALGATLVSLLSFALLYDGVVVPVAFAAVVYLGIVAALTLPQERLAGAVAGGVLGAGLILALDRVVPWPQLGSMGVASARTVVYALIGLAGLIVLAELLLAYQHVTTIRVRLIGAFVLLVVVVAATVTAVSISVGLRSTRRQALQQLEAIAALKSRELDSWADGLQRDLEAVIAEGYELERARALLGQANTIEYRRDAARALRSYLVRVMERGQQFDELFLMDVDGTVVLSTDAGQEGRVYGPDALPGRGRRGPYLQPPSLPTPSSPAYVVVVRPLVDGHGELLGVLGGRAGLRGAEEILLERAGLDRTGKAYLVDAQQTLLTELWSDLQGHYMPSGSAAAVVGSRRAGSGTYPNSLGERVLAAYTWLPRLQAALVIEQSLSEVIGAARLTVLANGGVALLAVCLAVAVSLLFARGISDPLAALADTVTRVAAGERQLEARVEGQDEIGALARAFNRLTAQMQELIVNLEQRVSDRTKGLETAAEVSRATASILDPTLLTRQVVDLVRERFSLYYVGLFMLDQAQEFAVLRAGTGEPGRLMLAQGHRLKVGGASMIGQCVATAKAVVQLREGGEALRYANPLLPDTRSELALPMRSRGRVTGAMTVQSEQEGAFDEPYIGVLQTIADQVAVAIDNAQLFEAAQAALKQAEEVHRRYLGQAWKEYIASREIGGYEYGGEGVQQRGEMLPLGHEPLAEVGQVVQERRTVLGDPSPDAADEGAGQAPDREAPSLFALTVPVIQGGQVVAALGFQREQMEWTAEEIALAEAIAEQLGLALDNQRLLEETQRRAAREEVTRQISDRVRAAIDLEEILRVTAQSLSRQLSASEVFVRLGTERTLLGQEKVEPRSW